MRALALFVLVFAVLFLGLPIIFVFRFDPEPFRPQIAQILGQALKTSVRIKKISIEKKFPPAVNFEGIQFFETETGFPWLQAERAQGEFDFKELATRQRIGFKNILFEKPGFQLKRRKDGSWNFPEPVLPLRFVKGTLSYQDDSESPVFAFQLHSLDGSIERSPAGVKIHLKGGFSETSGPQMLLEAEYDPRGQLTQFELKEPSGVWSLQGEIYLSKGVRFKGVFEIHSFEMGRWILPRFRSHEYITGVMTARLEGFGEGTHPRQIKQTLVLDGPIDVRDGSFHRLNFIKEVLAGLSPMPEFANLLSSKLQNSEAGELLREDMPFDMLRAELHMAQGSLTFQEALVSHGAYLMEGEGGWAVLENNVDFRAKLVLMEAFSRSLAEQAREFIPLRNSQGRIVIPFKYRGLLPGASVYPDLNYIATQYFQKGTPDLGETNQQGLSKFWESKKS